MFARQIPRQLPLCRAYSKNAQLVEKVREIIRQEELQNTSASRIRALTQGVEFVNRLQYKLTSIEVAEGLPVSPAFVKVLADYLPSIETQAISKEREKELLRELTSFDGLSRKRASQLILAGYRTKTDLLCPKYFNMLTENAKYNIRFASHLEKPVTRQQTEAFTDFIRDILPKYEVIPVGSYRRDAPTSSCARILIIHPDMLHVPDPPAPPSGYLHPLRTETLIPPGLMRDAHMHSTIMPLLKGRGLTVSSRLCKWWSWSGILRVPERRGGVWETNQQRLEGVSDGEGEFVLGRISMLPSKSRGAALLYHTCTKTFLQLITHKAAKLGLYFNQTGLWKWHPDPSEQIVGVSFHPESDAGIGEDDEEGKLTEKKTKKKKEEDDSTAPKKRGRKKKGEGLPVKKAEGFWQLLPSADEEIVFEQLGMEYVVPQRRGMEL
ncbi:hypothetical protein C0995_009818 [Termitomyces sp. Mi166|nr:hypothetical protein C0995_009818 [Termitomyces sp. Mi166\